MPHAGQEIEGFDGFRLKLIRTGEETGGELLEMEATYGPSGNFPPEHFHPSQHETFTVLEGAVKTIVGDELRRYETGETFEIPAGTPHRMAGDGPARVRWEVRPAMRTAEFFEGLYDGTAAGDYPAFLEAFAPEIRFTQPR